MKSQVVLYLKAIWKLIIVCKVKSCTYSPSGEQVSALIVAQMYSFFPCCCFYTHFFHTLAKEINVNITIVFTFLSVSIILCFVVDFPLRFMFMEIILCVTLVDSYIFKIQISLYDSEIYTSLLGVWVMCQIAMATQFEHDFMKFFKLI